MKVKIKSCNGGLPEYLTEGKEYPLSGFNEFGGTITDDEGYEIYIFISECCFLNGGSWEIVE